MDEKSLLPRKARKVIIMICYFSFAEALHLAKSSALLNEVYLRPRDISIKILCDYSVFKYIYQTKFFMPDIILMNELFKIVV